ncbi:hypothetical protein [Streptomyces phyllanthi]|uniref:hypothetical protein n=1 Tax=Streptomyces phyllanthi TaxID=1803180 RepID=UPI00128B1F58|nr:hypothetical protein [Streptomyces phyllanthi]
MSYSWDSCAWLGEELGEEYDDRPYGDSVPYSASWPDTDGWRGTPMCWVPVQEAVPPIASGQSA